MRRLILWALAYLALGAATAIGSIFVLAALPPVGPFDASGEWCLASWEDTGRFVICWTSVYKGAAYRGCFLSAPTVDDRGRVATRGWGVPLDTFVLPDAIPCARESLAATSPTLRKYCAIEFYGWPRLAAYSVTDFSFNLWNVDVIDTKGWPLVWWPHARPYSMHPFAAVIPLRPVWRGLAFNTAVFAGAYAFVPTSVWLTRAVRRRHRAARGLCPSCGYDLKGAPSAACPECGKTTT
jgi:hypothetical protein